MFDLTEVFSRQFTPVDGGYLYYPSRKGGGKLVTVDEFQQLLASWLRRTRPWKVAGFAFLAILIWTVLSEIFAPPRWGDDVIVWGSVAAISGWTFWAAYAPRRLVKDRPFVVPPRDLSEARRDARAMLNWPFVLFFLVASAAVFITHLIGSDRTAVGWAWLVGSGLFFAAYLRIAIQKFGDRQS